MSFIEELQKISYPNFESEKEIKQLKAQIVWAELKPFMLDHAKRGFVCITGCLDDEDYLFCKKDSVWFRWCEVIPEVAELARKEGFYAESDRCIISWSKK